MSDCPDCQGATNAIWGVFTAGCKGCQARMVARSPECFEAARTGRQTAAYRELLTRFDVSHQQVLEAAQRDFQSRRARV